VSFRYEKTFFFEVFSLKKKKVGIYTLIFKKNKEKKTSSILNVSDSSFSFLKLAFDL